MSDDARLVLVPRREVTDEMIDELVVLARFWGVCDGSVDCPRIPGEKKSEVGGGVIV